MATNRDGAINFKLMIAKDQDLKRKKAKLKVLKGESTIAFKIAYNTSIKQQEKKSTTFGGTDEDDFPVDGSVEGNSNESKYFSIPENRKNRIAEENERTRLVDELNALWKEIIPHDPNSSIEDVDVFEVHFS